MRVLHLYAGNLYGGIERLLATLAQHRCLVPAMQPEFGLCFRGRLWDELATCGAPVHDLGAVRFSRPWTVVRSRWRLRRLLRKIPFDAVMTHAAWAHALFARTVRRSGVRLAHWVHDVMTGPTNRFERWAGRTPPDLVVTNSEFTSMSIDNVFPGVHTAVVYLPVAAAETIDETAARRELREELHTPITDTVILQASRLEKWKGQKVLIEALGQLRGESGWTCWVAGGPQKAAEAEFLNELHEKTDKLGVANRVRFLGQRSDVRRLLAAADIVCQPNTGPEPFGIAFVEALSAARPVVTTDLGGAREIVTQETGMLIAPNSPEATACALRELLHDSERRRSLGAGGPARARTLCDPARQMGCLAKLLADKVPA